MNISNEYKNYEKYILDKDTPEESQVILLDHGVVFGAVSRPETNETLDILLNRLTKEK